MQKGESLCFSETEISFITPCQSSREAFPRNARSRDLPHQLISQWDGHRLPFECPDGHFLAFPRWNISSNFPNLITPCSSWSWKSGRQLHIIRPNYQTWFSAVPWQSQFNVDCRLCQVSFFADGPEDARSQILDRWCGGVPNVLFSWPGTKSIFDAQADGMGGQQLSLWTQHMFLKYSELVAMSLIVTVTSFCRLKSR